MINTNYDNKLHAGIQQTEGVQGTDPLKQPTIGDELPVVAAERDAQEGGTLPTMPAPKTKLDGVNLQQLFTAVPSLGAIALSLTTELSDTIRRANNEARFQEQQVIVEQMKKQADTMRDQAITNLCMSVAVAGVQIAMSAYQVKASAGALQSAQGMAGDMQAAFLQNQNLQIQGTAAGIGAAGSLLGGVKDFVSSMFDIEMKARDAEIERHRSFLMQLDSLNDSLKQVIQSAIQNQNAIQRNVNETRVKILT